MIQVGSLKDTLFPDFNQGRQPQCRIIPDTNHPIGKYIIDYFHAPQASKQSTNLPLTIGGGGLGVSSDSGTSYRSINVSVNFSIGATFAFLFSTTYPNNTTSIANVVYSCSTNTYSTCGWGGFYLSSTLRCGIRLLDSVNTNNGFVSNQTLKNDGKPILMVLTLISNGFVMFLNGQITIHNSSVWPNVITTFDTVSLNPSNTGTPNTIIYSYALMNRSLTPAEYNSLITQQDYYNMFTTPFPNI